MPTQKFKALLQLIRFDKPIGTLLLLWPTLWALWIAGKGSPDPKLVVIFVVGTFLMRSAGCIVNDIADRKFDGAVARTQYRPLVTGSVTLYEAAFLALALALLSLALVSLTNTLTVSLSVVAVLLASSYPYLKRHTNLPQLALGAAFSWGIPMAFAAQSNELPPELWLLYAGNLLWTIAYDTEYAMVDREDDIKIGIKSTAILFSSADRLIIAILQASSLLVLYLAGTGLGLGTPYYLALMVSGCLFIYQQYLIRDRHAHACFRAFLHNNWVGLAVFSGVVLNYLMVEGAG
jgi:4-hydroxybenzoate polyprenyltransferase